MTTVAEDALYAALTDIDELERLAAINLPLEAIPTEKMRPVVKWAIDEFYRSGRKQAPSRELLLANWGAELEAADVELIPADAERDTLESAVDHLKGLHAEREWQAFIKVAAMEMASAPITEKVETLAQITSGLFSVSKSLVDNTSRVEVTHGLESSWLAYQGREADPKNVIRGMSFGLDKVDQWTGGIRDGELAMLAAGPKAGKSLALNKFALHEWSIGRRAVLFTLENSVEMTYDRIMCMLAGVSARRYQHGELLSAEKEKVEAVRSELMNNVRASLHVISPRQEARTPEMMVREALTLGAQSIFVDQLTHVEHPNPGRKSRVEIFSDNIHEFKYLISTGTDKVPLMLAHQINREGVKAAEKTGHLEMYHLAESSGAERGADWVFGLYRSKVERENRAATLQILAARREDIKNWVMYWDVEMGVIEARRELTFND